MLNITVLEIMVGVRGRCEVAFRVRIRFSVRVTVRVRVTSVRDSVSILLRAHH